MLSEFTCRSALVGVVESAIPAMKRPYGPRVFCGSYRLNAQDSSSRVDELFSEMMSESDRGCILIGASAIDAILSSLLQLHLSRERHVAKHAVAPLFAAMGPLSTFSARIKLAYALALIPRWMFEDLEKIRRVRNEAAHEYGKKTFESPEVLALTRSLKAADRAAPKLEISRSRRSDTERRGTPSNSGRRFCKEQVRFVAAVSFIAGFLDGRIGQLRAIANSRKHENQSED